MIRTCAKTYVESSVAAEDKTRSNSPPTCAPQHVVCAQVEQSQEDGRAGAWEVLVKAVRLIAKAALRLMQA